MKKITKRSAFTLLEMLIVLGIIGVIVAIATTSFSTAQKKTRDSKRKQDMKMIQNALEQYYSVCGFAYPTSSASLLNVDCPTPGVVIMPTAPTDPKTGVSYQYTTDATGSTYTLCIPTRAATPPIFESESMTGTYCTTNQQ